jgi:hypothetical protein
MHRAPRFSAVRKVLLKFFCPVTKEAIEWDVPGDIASLAKRWSEEIRLACPHCGGEHSFCFREAYIEGAVPGLPSNSAA